MVGVLLSKGLLTDGRCVVVKRFADRYIDGRCVVVKRFADRYSDGRCVVVKRFADRHSDGRCVVKRFADRWSVCCCQKVC